MVNHLYNIGSEDEVSINQLAEIIKKVTGYEGKIVWDSNYPNGTPRKKLDSTKLNKLGWRALIRLPEGIKEVYNLYTKSI